MLFLDGNVHVSPGTEMDRSRTALGHIVLDFADLGKGDHAHMLVLDCILEPLFCARVLFDLRALSPVVGHPKGCLAVTGLRDNAVAYFVRAVRFGCGRSVLCVEWGRRKGVCIEETKRKRRRRRREERKRERNDKKRANEMMTRRRCVVGVR